MASASPPPPPPPPPLLFMAVAGAIEWIIREQGVEHILHYIHDFMLASLPGSQQCTSAMATTVPICTDLAMGIQVEPDKCEDPATVLTILGLEVNTTQMQLRLPAEKLQRLRGLVSSWRGRKCCTKRELLSLLGTLQHAAKVIKPVHLFVQRMIDLSTTNKHIIVTLQINKEFRSDLECGSSVCQNGTEYHCCHLSEQSPQMHRSHPKLRVPGVVEPSIYEGKWFQLQWDHSSSLHHITIKYSSQ